MGCFTSRSGDQVHKFDQIEVNEEHKANVSKSKIEPVKIIKSHENNSGQHPKERNGPEKNLDQAEINSNTKPSNNKKPKEQNNDNINEIITNWLNNIYNQSNLLILSQT